MVLRLLYQEIFVDGQLSLLFWALEANSRRVQQQSTFEKMSTPSHFDRILRNDLYPQEHTA